MIFGNPEEIAVTYEVLVRQPNSHFAFGTFNLFIGDKLLLSGGSKWTVNCIVNSLRNSKNVASAQHQKISKEDLFRAACTTRGYSLYDTAQIPSDWFGSDDPVTVKKIDAYIAEVESMCQTPPFGHDLEMYAELRDLKLQIFVFTSNTMERIVHSFDRGKVVFETCVPPGTVKKLCESLPLVV